MNLLNDDAVRFWVGRGWFAAVGRLATQAHYPFLKLMDLQQKIADH
jgi:hypothetical protein